MLVPTSIRVSKRAKRVSFMMSLVGLLLLLVSCQESAERSNVPAEGASALSRIPIEGVIVGDETGAEEEFKGALTVTNIAYEEGLVVSGMLTGSRLSEVGGSFENVPATLSASAGPEAGGGADATAGAVAGIEVEPLTCGVRLELGPVGLSGDVGSLRVSLVTVRLDLHTAPGSLGALLCTLARFLSTGADVPDALVARINALLDPADF